MFFWFIGTAVVTVGVVFRAPRFDYRLLIVGSVLPIADGVVGGARALHSVTVSVGLLAALMSSIDSTLNSASALLTMDFMQPDRRGWSATAACR